MEELVLRGKSVIDAIERGFKVKCNGWNDGQYIYLKNGEICDETNKPYDEKSISLNRIYTRDWYYKTNTFAEAVEHLYNGGQVIWLKFQDCVFQLDETKKVLKNIKTDGLWVLPEMFKEWSEIGGLICL